MKIVVCVKEINCEINPFDECALECALSFDGAEIHIVSMGRERAVDPIKRLSRLGDIKITSSLRHRICRLGHPLQRAMFCPK
ncbi:MAG: hypothetical protein L6V93_17295 [Clostridiales bacterium]|nr:MAG: hypothetical protein L6V93_17295 [Clostridiales bacterium]